MQDSDGAGEGGAASGMSATPTAAKSSPAVPRPPIQSEASRAALYASFVRNVTNKKSAVPPEVVAEWEAAITAKSKTAKNAMFQKWLSNGKSFNITVHVTKFQIMT